MSKHLLLRGGDNKHKFEDEPHHTISRAMKHGLALIEHTVIAKKKYREM